MDYVLICGNIPTWYDNSLIPIEVFCVNCLGYATTTILCCIVLLTPSTCRKGVAHYLQGRCGWNDAKSMYSL